MLLSNSALDQEPTLVQEIVRDYVAGRFRPVYTDLIQNEETIFVPIGSGVSIEDVVPFLESTTEQPATSSTSSSSSEASTGTNEDVSSTSSSSFDSGFDFICSISTTCPSGTVCVVDEDCSEISGGCVSCVAPTDVTKVELAFPIEYSAAQPYLLEVGRDLQNFLANKYRFDVSHIRYERAIDAR